MRVPPAEFRALSLDAHAVLRDVPLRDVTAVDLPCALDGRTIMDVRARTRHAFLCTALARTRGGYRLYFAVYVRPVSWLTPVYMALIEPFRRFVVYPALVRRVRRAWVAAEAV